MYLTSAPMTSAVRLHASHCRENFDPLLETTRGSDLSKSELGCSGRVAIGRPLRVADRENDLVRTEALVGAEILIEI
jgi:phage baseplate assembly protein W